MGFLERVLKAADEAAKIAWFALLTGFGFTIGVACAFLLLR